jgi:glycosyltransferase involved in cell wall biosynthesis
VPPDVALVAPYPPAGVRHGGHSGVASYTANLAHALADAGVQVEVIADRLDGDPDRFGDGAVQVRRAFTLGPGALPAAASAALATGASIVHLQWELFLYGGPPSLPGLLPALATLRRARAARPLVTTMHQVIDPSEIDRRYTRLHRVGVPAIVARTGLATVQSTVNRASSAVIVHEEPFRQWVPGATVIPHGIEVRDPADRAASRRHLGVDPDRFVALCFGFLAPYKGVEVVLEAAALAGPGVEVVIAGGEHPRLAGRDQFAAELRARYGHAARFTGWVPEDDVARWFAAADVAVFPYPKPFAASGALALALALGTPVLMSPALARCAGAPSTVTVPLDPAALAGRLHDLARQPQRLDDLAGWATTLADGRTWPRVARRHADLYEELIHDSRTAGRRLRAG